MPLEITLSNVLSHLHPSVSIVQEERKYWNTFIPNLSSRSKVRTHKIIPVVPLRKGLLLDRYWI